MNELSLKGRTAVITGVSRRIGIGYAVARRLLNRGAQVFLHHYAPFDAEQPWGGDSVEALVDELREIGPRVAHMNANFLTPSAPRKVIQAAVEAFDHIDILIANHAYGTGGALQDLTAEHIDRHLQVNVRGTLLLLKHFAAQHDGREGGRVILMTTGQHIHAMSDELAYIASKGALHQLTGSLSAHLIEQNITVNTINPGATDTGYADDETRQLVAEASPQGRWGEPDDAARLIAWLVSDEARWITGQVINSTGGGL